MPDSRVLYWCPLIESADQFFVFIDRQPLVERYPKLRYVLGEFSRANGTAVQSSDECNQNERENATN